jgi:hypothetical protein
MNERSNVPQWGRFEQAFTSAALYPNPFQDIELYVHFTAPSGRTITIDGFWNGGLEWCVRWMPNEIGIWTYQTECTDASNSGLHGQMGTFTCSEPSKLNCFEEHGAVRVSDDRRYLEHADGTPFFWLADTAWNGPMCSTPDEWNFYLSHRVRQKFTAVQWIATQWISAPDGDWYGEFAFSGHDRITVHPTFFQRLDQKIVAMNRAGLLSVPVMLWAASWGPPAVNARNPGYALPEDQAIRLAKYMLARWGAYHTVWMLPGDGDYRGEKSERWKRIGRAVFGNRPHAPVALHPGGMQWILDEFINEDWMDLLVYQSGHSDDDNALNWIVCGPPSTGWTREPVRPFINVEAPYERHFAFGSGKVHDDHSVRRATCWSLLVSPTAGVTYGGHGVWAWDDGTKPPIGHDKTGIPLPWREALTMPAAEQLSHLIVFFSSIEWWKLRPAQECLAAQPGDTDKRQYVTAATNESVTVIYLPQNDHVVLNTSSQQASWFDPRTGTSHATHGKQVEKGIQFDVPSEGDWILLFKKEAP